ncbi:hypothetical protein Ppa06_56460 [Planomonospora parontospora subsp. parontospora]|uniref:Uncharacterized protein n=2 Tax=Planomonospora parontospora TaxID=58119 RepID=A0AA37BNI4_9ACTN|nr:hypothetical protein GCM10010126_65380 [Planomonospora parontospora]GII11848.1 hypothetical protein Ppa06_56460 [Planomonospora parontospora subsp. parontospora]
MPGAGAGVPAGGGRRLRSADPRSPVGQSPVGRSRDRRLGRSRDRRLGGSAGAGPIGKVCGSGAKEFA